MAKVGRPKVINSNGMAEILQLSKQGLGVRKISNQLGISKSSVHRFLKENKSEATPGPPPPPTFKAEQPKQYRVFNIPHSAQITDALLEEVKAELGFHDVSYINLIVSHQKKCTCHICIRIRKTNWLKLKSWADQNVNK